MKPVFSAKPVPCKPVEYTRRFAITIVWGGALDAYSYVIAEYWFLKHIFYVPEFAPGSLLLKLSGLNSIESEVVTIKLLFLSRLITEHKMTPLIKRSL